MRGAGSSSRPVVLAGVELRELSRRRGRDVRGRTGRGRWQAPPQMTWRSVQGLRRILSSAIPERYAARLAATAGRMAMADGTEGRHGAERLDFHGPGRYLTPMTDEGPSDRCADVLGPRAKTFATGENLRKALADLPDVVRGLGGGEDDGEGRARMRRARASRVLGRSAGRHVRGRPVALLGRAAGAPGQHLGPSCDSPATVDTPEPGGPERFPSGLTPRCRAKSGATAGR